jgi:hypothetical protein
MLKHGAADLSLLPINNYLATAQNPSFRPAKHVLDDSYTLSALFGRPQIDPPHKFDDSYTLSATRRILPIYPAPPACQVFDDSSALLALSGRLGLCMTATFCPFPMFSTTVAHFQQPGGFYLVPERFFSTTVTHFQQSD